MRGRDKRSWETTSGTRTARRKGSKGWRSQRRARKSARGVNKRARRK